jgi:hypothetical protein
MHYENVVRADNNYYVSAKTTENVCEKEPMRAPQNGRFIKNYNQYAIGITLNTKSKSNKENIHEFNFKAAKNKEFFEFNFKISFEQETFSVTKT